MSSNVQPQGQGGPPPDKYLCLSNEFLTVGVDPARGGGICWLSAPGQANLLNAFDCGRFVQQSYYGRDDGSMWNGKPWRWNPVQCGSWQNAPARVLACRLEGPDHILTEVIPRNWAGQELLEDVTMRADIKLVGKHVHVRYTMTYKGCAEHPVRIQELPAVFVCRRLGELVFYDGPQPWQGKALQRKAPGPTNENFRITENWAAWVDPTGRGVGVWTPGSMTAYRVGGNGSSACSDCSYFAPTMRFAVRPGVLTYHTFITLGTVEDIRKEFSGIRGWAAANRPQLLQCDAMTGATLAI